MADLEHEFWVSRDPVRLGIAARQHERDLQLSGRQRIRYPPSLAGGSGHRLDCPADHRRHERPHLELARPPPSLLFSGRDPFQPCVIRHARFQQRQNGRQLFVDSGCQHQYQHGAVPRFRGGQIEP